MTQASWQDPRGWSEYRNVRRSMRIGTVLMTIAIAGFIPSAWIILMPMDPTLRPDLVTPWAWTGLVICAVAAYAAQTIVRRARARFDQAIYAATQRTRDMAATRAVPLETDLGEIFPPILISRQYRKLGVVGPTPLIVSLDQIDVVIADGRGNDDDAAPRQPHLALRLRDLIPNCVYVIAGRGLGRPNLEQTIVLGERLKDFIDPGSSWDTKHERTIDVAAFIESMRVKQPDNL